MDFTDDESANVAKAMIESSRQLRQATVFAIPISNDIQNVTLPLAHQFANVVLTKAWVHSTSMAVLAEAKFIDTSAIMALARTHIDAMLMFDYLHEVVSPEEWHFRHLLLTLHFGTNNVKFLRASPPINEDMVRRLKGENERYREKLKAHPHFASISDDAKKRSILSGERVFVDGSHSVAARNGWDGDEFQSVYSYYSGHIHVLPLSFMALIEPASERKNALLSLATATLAMRMAKFCLLRMTLKSIEVYPNLPIPISSELVATYKSYIARFERFQKSFKVPQ